ncbi:outer membrane beta-barrel protein, partial [Algoriphagus sp. NF]|uniref:outer membrane beta-barrel protein n=1 Tax=Algoriphagus sp. NF TaxID=2992756 RepID=UPI00237A9522
DDYRFTMPSFKVFIRRNFEGFYLSSGLNFLQDDIGYQMPANLPSPDVLGHYMRVRTNAVEIPLIIGHRLEFFEYLRLFAGVSPTFSFNSNPSISSVYESNFSEQENRDATQAIQEFQSALIDSFSPFYINGTVGVGFDYKIISIEFQLDRTLTSLSKNERATIGQTGGVVFDERRTRKTLQVGLKIPLKK